MKLSTFLIVKAVICFIFGLGYLIAPVFVASMYEITLDADGVIMSRFFAALLLGIGIILYLGRNTDWSILKNVILALCVADTIGFVIALAGQLSGAMNSLGWIIVAIWLLLAFGLAYYRFLTPAKS